MKLTDESVQTAPLPAIGQKDRLFFDETAPGFGLRVTLSGKRVFIFQYNYGTLKRRMPLGEWGRVTVAAARRRYATLYGAVRAGKDPAGEEKAKQAATAAAEALARAQKARDAYTVDTLIGDWTDHHLAARSASYRNRVPGELRAALKKWLTAPADDFARADAVHVLDAAKKNRGPVAANRLRAEARACWTWAVKRGSVAVNPWEATPRPLAKETARERVLSDNEVAAVYTAAGGVDEPWGTIVRLLILTGQRRGEVAGMEWGEVDLDRGVWSLPGERTKNGQPHTVPLTVEAVALIRAVKRRHGARFVFEGPRKTAFSGFGRLKTTIDAEVKASGLTMAPWTMHDLRRTLATGLQRLGVRLEVTEAVLNHISGSRDGIVGVYQRHGWDREKDQALTAWAKHVMSQVEGNDRRQSNVVALREALA